MDHFIVSARKYRPATFMSVVGQQHITSTLKNAIARNQLAHAYLFCGPRGVGKTTCARIFAKAINCQNPRDNEACGECESCRNFAEGRSFNIHELDAASNNSVDDIRTLTEQVRIPPQIGRYSVYIIDEVHMLSASAFNAFLKTLEEPPAHAIFILATTEKHKIIPTILSRCQIYDFNRIRVEDSVGYLKYIAGQESITFDDESLNLIAQKADGGMRDALSMFDKAVAFCGNSLNFKEVARTLNVLDYDIYFSVLDMVSAGDYKAVLRLFDEVLRNGFSGQTFVAGLNAHLRDLLLSKDPSTVPLIDVAGSLLERYRQQSARLDAVFLFDAISLMSAVDSSFRTATNQRLHVELGLMKLCGLGQKKNRLEGTAAPLPELNAVPDKAVAAVGSAAPVAKGEDVSDAGKVAPAAEVSQNPALSGDDRPMQTASNTVPADDGSRPVAAANVPAPPSESDNFVSQSDEYDDDARDACGEDADRYEPESDDDNADVPSAGMARDAADDEGDVVVPCNGVKVSGVSLSNILKRNGIKAQAASGDESDAARSEEPDPEFGAKLAAVWDEFIESVSRDRPRFAAALMPMTFSGHTIRAAVSTSLLKDDMVQNQKTVFDILRRLSGITGPIELNVEIKEEDVRDRVPVKPEEKLAYLRAKNPLVDELRREFGLEIE